MCLFRTTVRVSNQEAPAPTPHHTTPHHTTPHLAVHITAVYPQLHAISSETQVSILNACHPDTLHVRQEGREDPWLFVEAKMGSVGPSGRAV